jgi:ubiquinone/menaquinone biosynthesis C-methylase UbiE
MSDSQLLSPSARPAGHGITLGTPRIYDLTAGLLFFGTRRRSYRELLLAAAVGLGDRVLDIGCGPGYFARMLAETVGPHGSVVGIDAAPEMVDYARRKARRLPNCRFQTGAAQTLPFPDGAFDVVTSSLMLHHVPEEDRLTSVGEMKRVLRPGGRLLLAEFSLPQDGVWRIVAAITGHAGKGALFNQRKMVERVSPVEPIVAEAGFSALRSGDAPPWLHYVMATRPSGGGGSHD